MFDPYALAPSDYPFVVLADKTFGWVESLIKMRTRGYYNHIMIAHRPGYFASQGWGYKEVPFKDYMKRGRRLKFIKILGLTPVQNNLVIASVEKKLKSKWWKQRYDFLGILGQALGAPWIQSPWADFCSEDVPEHFFPVIDYTTDVGLEEFLATWPLHGSPEDANAYFKRHPEYTKVVGRYDSDEL